MGGYAYLTDNTYGWPSISSNWGEIEITQLSQGAASTQRIGNQIKLRGFYMKGTLLGGQVNGALDDNYNVVRIVVGLYDSSSTTPLTASSVVMSGAITPETVKGLIKKYVDKTVILRSAGRDSTGYLPAAAEVKKFVKCHPTIVYSGTGATTAQRKLIVSMLSDSSASPNPGFVNGYRALWFEDA